jgi:hypothetical protein
MSLHLISSGGYSSFRYLGISSVINLIEPRNQSGTRFLVREVSTLLLYIGWTISKQYRKTLAHALVNIEKLTLPKEYQH